MAVVLITYGLLNLSMIYTKKEKGYPESIVGTKPTRFVIEDRVDSEGSLDMVELYI